jgi:hypothetical protein
MSDSIRKKPLKRKAATSIRVDPNVRALKVYPVSGTRKTTQDLNSVGVKLTRDQAVHLARVLLAVSQDWDDVEITAYRLAPRRSDGTYGVTVTTRSGPT